MMLLVFAVAAFCLTMVRFAVRPSPIAGQWYPDAPERLSAMLQGFLDDATVPVGLGRPRVLVAPHAGYTYSGPCAAFAFKTLEGHTFERVAVMAPSHRVAIGGVSVGDYDAFETPLGRIGVDRSVAARLVAASPVFVWDRRAQAQEHALEMQLPFLQHVLGCFELIPLVVQGIDGEAIEAVAGALADVLDDRTLLVVSTDFTHYGEGFGYLPFTDNVPEKLRALDMGAIERIERGDLKGFLDYCRQFDCTICGREPLVATMVLAHKKGFPPARLLHYTTSGESTGDYSHTVSYAAMGIYNGFGNIGVRS